MENRDGEVGTMAKLTIVKVEKLGMSSMVDNAIGRNFKSFFVDPIFGHRVGIGKGNRFGSIQDEAQVLAGVKLSKATMLIVDLVLFLYEGEMVMNLEFEVSTFIMIKSRVADGGLEGTTGRANSKSSFLRKLDMLKVTVQHAAKCRIPDQRS